MLELAHLEASVILCVASPAAVDAVRDLGTAIRVAPDEVLLLDRPDAAIELLDEATRRAQAVDEDAVVLDTSDGWSAWTLEGEGDAVREGFSHLSALQPPGSVPLQGTVTGVPAKVLAEEGGLRLLVPAMWGEHVRLRVLEDLATLGVTERPEPRAWSHPERASRSGT